MDDDICRWVLEFILRSSMDDHLLKRVMSVIPVPDKDHRLKKTVLLRAIQSEISDAAITEKMLENFEMIEQLDKSESVAIMESMKAAYWAVAVECTVKYLVGNINKHRKYIDAVKRIWRGKVTELERSGKSELVSRELKGWKDEVEAALWDKDVRKKLIDMNTRNDALRLVGEYLGEAWAILGPSFLQLSASLIDNKTRNETQSAQLERKSTIKEIEGAEKTPGESEDVGGSRGIELPSQTPNCAEPMRQGSLRLQAETKRTNLLNISDDGFEELVVLANSENNEEVQEMATEVQELATEAAARTEVQESAGKVDKDTEGAALNDPNPSVDGTDKSAAKDEENLKFSVLPRRKFLSSHRRVRGGAKISDPDDLENNTSSGKYSCLHTPEVNRVQEALKTSFLDLQAVVRDPLPDALRAAEAVVSELAKKNKNNEHSSENQNNADSANPAAARPSLMERNNTARTYEWNDSIDGSPERTGNHISRLHLPSPKRKAISPLKKYEVTKFTRRRKIKRWSLLEEDTLRIAVERFGRGNWKLILNSHRDIFEERTEVDLKDKWRNMTRY